MSKRVALLPLLLLLLLMAGCSQGDDVTTVSMPAPNPIPWPSLAMLDETGQGNLQRSIDRFKQEIAKPAQSAAQQGIIYGEMGHWLYAYGFKDAAKVCYQNAQMLTPELYVWPYMLANLYAQSGNRETAIRGYMRALYLLHENGKGKVPMQQVVAGLVNLARLLIEEGEYEAAAGHLQQALSINPKASAALSAQAANQEQLGDVSDAITSLEQAVELLPNNAKLHYRLAQLYRKMGDRTGAQEAMARFSEASDKNEVGVFDPLLRDVKAYLVSSVDLTRKADRLYLEGKSLQAAKLYRQAITLDANSAVPRINLAILYAGEGKLDEAETLMDEAAELEPNSHLVILNRGRLWQLMGRHQEVLDYLDQASKTNPDDEVLLLIQARSCMALEYYDKALEKFDAILVRNPVHRTALLGRSAALYQSGSEEEGLTALELASQRLPNDPYVAQQLANQRASEQR